jgi:hypothetical protein
MHDELIRQNRDRKCQSQKVNHIYAHFLTRVKAPPQNWKENERESIPGPTACYQWWYRSNMRSTYIYLHVLFFPTDRQLGILQLTHMVCLNVVNHSGRDPVDPLMHCRSSVTSHVHPVLQPIEIYRWCTIRRAMITLIDDGRSIYGLVNNKRLCIYIYNITCYMDWSPS